MRLPLLGWLGLIALCWLAPLRALEIGEPLVEAVADGGALPDANVSALAEDRLGFLWVGTPTGLLRFDGYRFRRYGPEEGNPDSFSGGFVNVLRVAGDGRLWIGTVADGLWVFDPTTERFTRYRHAAGDPHSLAHDGVYALGEDRQGRLWIGTVAGLDRFDADSGRFVHVHHAAPAQGQSRSERIWSLRVDRRGDLWVGTNDGISRLAADGERLERVDVPPTADGFRLLNRPVISLLDSSDGRLWLGTAQDGVFAFDPAGNTLQRPYPEAADEVAHGTTTLLQPDAGTLWVGRIGGGGGIDVIDLASGDLQHRFRHDPALRSSLVSDDVRVLLRDRAGKIWVGGYGAGLQRIDPQVRGVRMIGHSPYRADMLSNANVSSVIERSNGELWVGTRGEGIDILDARRGLVGGHRAAPSDPTALGSGWVAAMAEAGDGGIWVGGFGLYRFDPQTRQFSAWLPPGRTAPLTVRRLLVDSRGTLWIGSSPGLWRLPAGGDALLPVRNADGSPLREDVNALVEDPRGVIWVGCDPGLYTVDVGADALRPIDVRADGGSGLSAASVVGLLVDHNGNLWMDSADGLYRLRRQVDARAEFEAVSARLGIGGKAFGANLMEDASGRIWTSRYVFDPASDALYPLTRADGVDLGTVWFRSHFRTRDGLLLIGGSKGLLVIDPAHFRPWAYEPPVVVTELRVDGQPQRFGSATPAIELAPDQRSFAVEVAALDFTAPERNRYAYRLQGFDRDWIDADATQRVATYTNLWPGEYRLQVRGSNRSGAWSRHELSLPVIVHPAFWQTPWFAGLGLLALGSSVVGGHRLRTARLKRHALALEREVAQRTGQLAQANEQLQHSHDNLRAAHSRLLETQQQLVMQEKMASLGQLVAGVAHEINTPLGVAVTAASMLSETTAETKRRFDSGELRRPDLAAFLDLAIDSSAMVDVNLARAAQLVRSFKQVSVDRGSDDRRHFDLCDYLRTLVESLQPACSRSGVELALDCSLQIDVDSYPGALGQVLTQLTQNALLHAFDPAQAGHIRIAAAPLDDGRVELRLTDDGRGIPAADLPHVFEPFFTRKRSAGNAGLGLHIAFNLVTVRLGGEITVASDPGHGSCFVLRLPREAPE